MWKKLLKVPNLFDKLQKPPNKILTHQIHLSDYVVSVTNVIGF